MFTKTPPKNASNGVTRGQNSNEPQIHEISGYEKQCTSY